MNFWLTLDLLIFALVILSWFFNEKTNNKLAIIITLLLIVISGFRYMIGGDYSEYITWFYQAEIGGLYPEISFAIMATYFRENNISYQMLFMIYSILVQMFFYLGISYYTKNSRERILALFLFTVAIAVGYWQSMNTIREMTAVVISFYASRYIVEKQSIKYGLLIVLATLFHYSAIIMLILYFMPMVKSKVKLIAIPFVGIVVLQLHIENVLHILDSIGFSRGMSYLDSNGQIGVGLLFSFILYFICVVLKKTNSSEDVFVYNAFMYGLFIYLALLNVATIGPRISQFFFIYQFLLVIITLRNMKLNFAYKKLMCLGLCAFLIVMHSFFLKRIANEEVTNYRVSAGNIEYKMNLNFTE